MTTPSIDLSAFMPQTTLFTGTGSGNQRLTTGGLDYVYLPQGASLVQVVATDLKGTTIRVDLTKAGGRSVALAIVPVEAETQRIFTDTFANANQTNQGMWLRFWCTGFTASHATTGTLGVTITPLQAN